MKRANSRSARWDAVRSDRWDAADQASQKAFADELAGGTEHLVVLRGMHHTASSQAWPSDVPTSVPGDSETARTSEQGDYEGALRLAQEAIDEFGEDVCVAATSEGGLFVGTPAVGLRFWPDNDAGGRHEYAGAMANKMREGLGIMFFADGTTYAGEWNGGKPHGHGKETYPDGSTYTGQFEDDQRQGLGSYVSADASVVHDGVWRDGLWQQSVGADTHVKLDQAVLSATQARDRAVRFGRKLLVLRKLAKCMPPFWHGPLVRLVEAGGRNVPAQDSARALDAVSIQSMIKTRPSTVSFRADTQLSSDSNSTKRSSNLPGKGDVWLRRAMTSGGQSILVSDVSSRGSTKSAGSALSCAGENNTGGQSDLQWAVKTSGDVGIEAVVVDDLTGRLTEVQETGDHCQMSSQEATVAHNRETELENKCETSCHSAKDNVDALGDESAVAGIDSTCSLGTRKASAGDRNGSAGEEKDASGSRKSREGASSRASSRQASRPGSASAWVATEQDGNSANNYAVLAADAADDVDVLTTTGEDARHEIAAACGEDQSEELAAQKPDAELMPEAIAEHVSFEHSHAPASICTTPLQTAASSIQDPTEIGVVEHTRGSSPFVPDENSEHDHVWASAKPSIKTAGPESEGDQIDEFGERGEPEFAERLPATAGPETDDELQFLPHSMVPKTEGAPRGKSPATRQTDFQAIQSGSAVALADSEQDTASAQQAAQIEAVRDTVEVSVDENEETAPDPAIEHSRKVERAILEPASPKDNDMNKPGGHGQSNKYSEDSRTDNVRAKKPGTPPVPAGRALVNSYDAESPIVEDLLPRSSTRQSRQSCESAAENRCTVGRVQVADVDRVTPQQEEHTQQNQVEAADAEAPVQKTRFEDEAHLAAEATRFDKMARIAADEAPTVSYDADSSMLDDAPPQPSTRPSTSVSNRPSTSFIDAEMEEVLAARTIRSKYRTPSRPGTNHIDKEMQEILGARQRVQNDEKLISLFNEFCSTGAGLGGMFQRGRTMDFGEFLSLLKHLGIIAAVRGGQGLMPKAKAALIFKKVNRADGAAAEKMKRLLEGQGEVPFDPEDPLGRKRKQREKAERDDMRELECDEFLAAMNLVARELGESHRSNLLFLKEDATDQTVVASEMTKPAKIKRLSLKSQQGTVLHNPYPRDHDDPRKLSQQTERLRKELQQLQQKKMRRVHNSRHKNKARKDPETLILPSSAHTSFSMNNDSLDNSVLVHGMLPKIQKEKSITSVAEVPNNAEKSVQFLRETSLSVVNRHWNKTRGEDMFRPLIVEEEAMVNEAIQMTGHAIEKAKRKEEKEAAKTDEQNKQMAVQMAKKPEKAESYKREADLSVAKLKDELDQARKRSTEMHHQFHTYNEKIKFEERTADMETELAMRKENNRIACEALEELQIMYENKYKEAFLSAALKDVQEMRMMHHQQTMKQADINKSLAVALGYLHWKFDETEEEKLSVRNRLFAAVSRHAKMLGDSKMYLPTMYLMHALLHRVSKQGDQIASMSVLGNAGYAGQWRHGKPHGVGVEMLHSDLGPGNRYEGQFADDFRHGLGAITMHEHTLLYEGMWWRGKRHGFGVESCLTPIKGAEPLPIAFVQYESGIRTRTARFDVEAETQLYLLSSVREIRAAACAQAREARDNEIFHGVFPEKKKKGRLREVGDRVKMGAKIARAASFSRIGSNATIFSRASSNKSIKVDPITDFLSKIDVKTLEGKHAALEKIDVLEKKLETEREEAEQALANFEKERTEFEQALRRLEKEKQEYEEKVKESEADGAIDEEEERALRKEKLDIQIAEARLKKEQKEFEESQQTSLQEYAEYQDMRERVERDVRMIRDEFERCYTADESEESEASEEEDGPRPGEESDEYHERKKAERTTKLRSTLEEKKRIQEAKNAERKTQTVSVEHQRVELEKTSSQVEGALSNLKSSTKNSMLAYKSALVSTGFKTGRLYGETDQEMQKNARPAEPTAAEFVQYLCKQGIDEELAHRMTKVYFQASQQNAKSLKDAQVIYERERVQIITELITQPASFFLFGSEVTEGSGGSEWHSEVQGRPMIRKRYAGIKHRFMSDITEPMHGHSERAEIKSMDHMPSRFMRRPEVGAVLRLMKPAETILPSIPSAASPGVNALPRSGQVTSKDGPKNAQIPDVGMVEQASRPIVVPVDMLLEQAVAAFCSNRHTHILLMPGTYQLKAPLEITKALHIVGEDNVKVIGSWKFKGEGKSSIKNVFMEFWAKQHSTNFQRLLHIDRGELLLQDCAVLCPGGYPIWADGRAVLNVLGCIAAGAIDGRTPAQTTAVAMDFSRVEIKESRLENCTEACVFVDKDAEVKLVQNIMHSASAGVMMNDRVKIRIDRCYMRLFTSGAIGQMKNNTDDYETRLEMRNSTIFGNKWAFSSRPTTVVEENNTLRKDPVPPQQDGV